MSSVRRVSGFAETGLPVRMMCSSSRNWFFQNLRASRSASWLFARSRFLIVGKMLDSERMSLTLVMLSSRKLTLCTASCRLLGVSHMLFSHMVKIALQTFAGS